MEKERLVGKIEACNLKHSWFLPLIVALAGLFLSIFFGIQYFFETTYLILVFLGLLLGIATLKARLFMPIILLGSTVFLFDYSPFLNWLLIIDTLRNLIGTLGVLFFWGFAGVTIGNLIRDFYDKWLCNRAFLR